MNQKAQQSTVGIDQEQATLRAALYARVSTDEQNKDDKVSIKHQLKEMGAYANANGWEVVREYEEDDTGQKKLRDRDAGFSVMEDAHNDVFDIFVLYDDDRLARDVDAINAKIARRDFRNLLIQVTSVHQPRPIVPRDRYFPDEDDSSLWIESGTDAAAAQQIRSFRRRHKFGMLNRVRRGKMAGSAPTGYYQVPVPIYDGAKKYIMVYKVDEDYRWVIVEIFTLYKSGLSYEKVAQQLNMRGIKTPHRAVAEGKQEVNGDRLWTSTTIKGIINNPVYYGATVYNKAKSVRAYREDLDEWVTVRKHQPMDTWTVTEGDMVEHEAIISKPLYIECQEIKKSRGNYGRTYGSSHMLSGLIGCGLCKYSMHKSGGWQGGYYECNRYRKTGKMQCERNSMRLVHLEDYVVNYIEELAKKPEVLPHLKIKRDTKKLETITREKATLEKRIPEANIRLDRIHHAFETGAYDEELHSERTELVKLELRQVYKRLLEIDAEIADLKQATSVKVQIIEILANFGATFRSLPIEEQKTILRKLIKRIWVTHKKVEIIFNLD